jgi:hypothetical protein
MTPQFDYDVAFSFLAADEGIAVTINDLLQSRLRTFIYSERQKELAGKDGETVFNSVFGQKSRFVVILYRPAWGETPWTRVEKIAIQNRTLEEGHDFLMCAPLDTPPIPPKWLPKARIWIGLDRWGPEGAAAVIEARVQELGGKPVIESVATRAARLNRSRQFDGLRERFLSTEEGVKAATAAYEQLRTRTESLVSETAAAESTLNGLKAALVRGEFVVFGLGPACTIRWENMYANTLQHASLLIEFCSRLPAHLSQVPWGKHRTLQKSKLSFGLVPPDRQCWIAPNWQRKQFDSDELAEELVKRYLDISQSWKPDDQSD